MQEYFIEKMDIIDLYVIKRKIVFDSKDDYYMSLYNNFFSSLEDCHEFIENTYRKER